MPSDRMLWRRNAMPVVGVPPRKHMALAICEYFGNLGIGEMARNECSVYRFVECSEKAVSHLKYISTKVLFIHSINQNIRSSSPPLTVSHFRFTMLAPTLLLGALATLLDTASAHGFVTGIRAGGTFTAGSEPNWYYQPANQRKQTAGWDALNQDNGFVEPAALGSSDINCHKSATAGRQYVTVAAGSTVEIPWNTWPDSHKGPIINYIAPCNGTSLLTCRNAWPI
jgi:hypothetical protein